MFNRKWSVQLGACLFGIAAAVAHGNQQSASQPVQATPAAHVVPTTPKPEPEKPQPAQPAPSAELLALRAEVQALRAENERKLAKIREWEAWGQKCQAIVASLNGKIRKFNIGQTNHFQLATATGHWETRCNGSTCSQVWVKDEPAEKKETAPVQQQQAVMSGGCSSGNCGVRRGLFGRWR